MIMLANDIAKQLQTWGIGVYETANPDLRTIYVGDFPAPTVEGITIIASASPPPHIYVDTEYPVLDFWARSPHTDRAYDLLYRVYEQLQRRPQWQTENYNIYLSQALGSIVDVDRDAEGGKLYRLTVQFICRNLNHVS